MHRARRLSLQGLCCLDVQGAKVKDLVDEFVSDSGEQPGVMDVARLLLNGTLADRQGCDELLVRHARHWDLSRLAMVDRNILRQATFELRGTKTPVSIVISEAIQLAQEFSTAESPRFINGVLDAIAKELRQGDEGQKDKQG